MAIRLEVPAFAYDYINGYSGTYSNVPYVSKYYPSYTYYNYNAYIPKSDMPAFVCNANYGVCGQGFTYYMYTSSASAEIQSNLPTFKDITMTWSQAIPITFGCPVGLCWFNFYASVYNNNEPVPNYYSNFTTNNIGFFVNSDHRLAFGGYNYSDQRPIVDVNYGIDMTPYMYTPAVQNSDTYCGHTFGIRYNAEEDALDLYVDNVETILASVTFNQIMYTAMNVINYFHSWDSLYNAWANYGGCIQNIYAGGCGLYVSNTSSSYNVYNQGNVYFDSWYTWVHNLNDAEFNAAMNHSFSMLPGAKNYSSLGIMEHCNMLTTINIPGTVGVIPRPFIQGNNINLVIFGEGITRISEQAVLGNIPLTIHVPQTAVDISNHAFRSDAGVNIPAVSYNMLERGDIASRYGESPYLNIPAYELPHYEQPVELNIGWFPGSILPTPRGNQFRNIPGVLNIPQIQYTLVENEGMYDITFNRIAGSVVFNQNVNQAMHSNMLGAHALSMNSDVATIDVFSREFPNMHEVRDVGIIDDHGFYLNQVTPGMVAVMGHVNGDYPEIPDSFGGHYVVRNILFSNALAEPYETPQYIKVPNLINGYNYEENGDPSSYYYGMPFYEELNIIGTKPYNDVYVHDGDTVVFAPPNPIFAQLYTPQLPVNYYFTNLNRVFITSNSSYYAVMSPNITPHNYVFENCNYVYVESLRRAPVDVNLLQIAGMQPREALIEDTDLSASDLTFNNFYYYAKPLMPTSTTPVGIYPWIHRDEYPIWLTGNIALVPINNYGLTALDKKYQTYKSNVFYFSGTAAYSSMNGGFKNDTLPGNITLKNMIGARPSFWNCSGDCNFVIRGMIAPIPYSGELIDPYSIMADYNPLVVNHTGRLNFDIDVDRVVLDTYSVYSGGSDEPTGMAGTPLFLAENCSDVDTVRIVYSDDAEQSETSLEAVKQRQLAGYAVAFNNCNIDTIYCGENCSLDFNHCNINHIIYSGGPVHHLGFHYCNVRCTIQPLLNNLTNAAHLHNTTFVDTTMYIPYNISGYCRYFTYNSTVSAAQLLVANIKGVSDVIIEDKINEPGIGAAKVELYTIGGAYAASHDVENVYIKGRVDPGFFIYDNTGTKIVNVTVDTPDLLQYDHGGTSFIHFSGLSNQHAYGQITLDNTVAIGKDTFYNINTTVRVHPNCSIHPNACNVNSAYHVATDISFIYGNGNKYATGINVNYLVNRQTASAPNNYNSIRDMFTINVVYNDGSEETTEDYTVWPNFGYYGGTSNTFHVIQLMNVCGVIPAPYGGYSLYEDNPYTANQYNTYTWAAAQQYMNFYDNDLNYPVCHVYASPNSSYSTRATISYINVAKKDKHILIVSNAYNVGPSRYYAKHMSEFLDYNYGRNNCANNYGVGYRVMIKNINFISNMNNYIQSFNGREHTVVLSPGRPVKALGHRSFVNSNVSQIYMPFMRDNYASAIYISKYINSWAINNAQQLYHIDFNYFAAQALYINGNAVINAPMLKYMTLPRNTKSVGIGAFNRTGLKEVKIPTGCTVSTNAFPADCTITYY